MALDYEKLYSLIDSMKTEYADNEEVYQKLLEFEQQMKAQELQETGQERIEERAKNKTSSNASMPSPSLNMLGTEMGEGSMGAGEGSVGAGEGISGTSEGAGGALGLGMAIGVGIGLQHGLAEYTNRYTEGVKSGDAFSGQFGSEPWLNFAYEKLGIERPSAGEKFDAAVKNRDWGLALKRAPSMLSYWGNPAERVAYEVISDKYGDKTGAFISPLNWLFDKLGG